MLMRYWWIEKDLDVVKQGRTGNYKRICTLTDAAYRQGAKLFYSYSEEARARCLRELAGEPVCPPPALHSITVKEHTC